jgi:hypothetical protein
VIDGRLSHRPRNFALAPAIEFDESKRIGAFSRAISCPFRDIETIVDIKVNIPKAFVLFIVGGRGKMFIAEDCGKKWNLKWGGPISFSPVFAPNKRTNSLNLGKTRKLPIKVSKRSRCRLRRL